MEIIHITLVDLITTNSGLLLLSISLLNRQASAFNMYASCSEPINAGGMCDNGEYVSEDMYYQTQQGYFDSNTLNFLFDRNRV